MHHCMFCIVAYFRLLRCMFYACFACLCPTGFGLLALPYLALLACMVCCFGYCLSCLHCSTVFLCFAALSCFCCLACHVACFATCCTMVCILAWFSVGFCGILHSFVLLCFPFGLLLWCFPFGWCFGAALVLCFGLLSLWLAHGTDASRRVCFGTVVILTTCKTVAPAPAKE